LHRFSRVRLEARFGSMAMRSDWLLAAQKRTLESDRLRVVCVGRAMTYGTMMCNAINNPRYAVAKRPSVRSMAVVLSMAALLIPVVALGAPADCTALRAAYRAAVPAAQVCDAKLPKPCAAVRPAALDDACHCQVSVNPERTQQLDRLLADYKAQRCVAKTGLCNRMCTAPVSTCDGGATGAAGLCGQAR
jgi:hypothetical protein